MRLRFALVLIGMAAVPAVLHAQTPPPEITGRAVARDGDDIVVTVDGKAQRVRLCGIDAPDRHRGAREAKAALGALVAGVEVRCVPVGGGTPCDGRSKARVRNRIIAQCFAGDRDLAAEMVRAGHACDWPKYSGGWYGRLVADAPAC